MINAAFPSLLWRVDICVCGIVVYIMHSRMLHFTTSSSSYLAANSCTSCTLSDVYTRVFTKVSLQGLLLREQIFLFRHNTLYTSQTPWRPRRLCLSVGHVFRCPSRKMRRPCHLLFLNSRHSEICGRRDVVWEMRRGENHLVPGWYYTRPGSSTEKVTSNPKSEGACVDERYRVWATYLLSTVQDND